MADPLSVSASIGGLVTLADLVFCRIFKYKKAVKGASNEISALLSEVGALYGVLNNLHLVSLQLDEKIFHTTMRTHYIHACTQTLEKLREILDKDDTSSVQLQTLESMKRKLHWPFSHSDVQTLLAEIERHKATLELALNVDSMSGLVQSLSLQSALRDSVDEIKTELKQRHEADTRVVISTQRQKILDSFGKLDPSENQNMGLKLRQPGTGLWFIESQEFLDWSQEENAKLWLYGIPGAGKTILASTVIEETLCTCTRNHAVAYFFCDYKDPKTHKPASILASLIQQIAKQDEQSFEKVQHFCDRHNPQYRDEFDYDPQELGDLLCDMTSTFDCTSIIVDGLDECGEKTADVTELLVSLNPGRNETTIKTLFLSRNEVEIRECLEDYTQVAIAAKSSDLRLYVGAEINSRVRKKRLRIKDQSLKDYIMERLVEGAEGM
ncbi:MAG: hypothetical protein Q9209_007074 [Squamulea sp. 1 TL-2023]